MINLDLAYERGLTEEEIENIELLQAFREEIHAALEKKELIPSIYVNKELLGIEERLSKLWKFESNEFFTFYKFWKVPKCQCPSLDNEDRYGLNMPIINTGCPLHSHLVSQLPNITKH